VGVFLLYFFTWNLEAASEFWFLKKILHAWGWGRGTISCALRATSSRVERMHRETYYPQHLKAWNRKQIKKDFKTHIASFKGKQVKEVFGDQKKNWTNQRRELCLPAGVHALCLRSRGKSAAVEEHQIDRYSEDAHCLLSQLAGRLMGDVIMQCGTCLITRPTVRWA
jgi:hypothetical protein